MDIVALWFINSVFFSAVLRYVVIINIKDWTL